MNKKAVTDIKVYIISIILFTFVVLGGLGILNQFQDGDSSFITDSEKYAEFNRTFNQYNTINSRVDAIQNSFDGASGDIGVLGFLPALIGSAWNTLKLTFSSFSFMTSVFLGMNSIFGVPAWIPSLIIMVIVVIIAYAMYKAIFQVN